jgi:hypothetical protein
VAWVALEESSTFKWITWYSQRLTGKARSNALTLALSLEPSAQAKGPSDRPERPPETAAIGERVNADKSESTVVDHAPNAHEGAGVALATDLDRALGNGEPLPEITPP